MLFKLLNNFSFLETSFDALINRFLSLFRFPFSSVKATSFFDFSNLDSNFSIKESILFSKFLN